MYEQDTPIPGCGTLSRRRVSKEVGRRRAVLGACVVSLVLSACGSGGGGLETGTTSIASGSDLAEAEVTESMPRSSDALASQAGSKSSAAPAPSASPQPVAAASNWVDTLVEDMTLYHDGPARTLEFIKGWGSGWGKPAYYPKPAGWTTAGSWGVIMADTSKAGTPPTPWRVAGPYTGNQAPNTRVQVRDIQLWWLRSDGAWVRGTHNTSPGGYMYHSSWKGEQYTSENDFRDESNNGGGKSARFINMNAPGSGKFQFDAWHWHFFGSRTDVPNGYVGFATAYFARKILHDPNGVDDRQNARLLADVAGDWWITPNAQWDNFKTNGPMGFSRFKYLSNDWQMISFHSLTPEQIRANPPPIIGRN